VGVSTRATLDSGRRREYGLRPLAQTFSAPQRLVVAVLGSGRLAETHLAALAELRGRDDGRGLRVDDRSVPIELALYGRDPAKVQALAERYAVRRTSTHLEELLDAGDVHVVDNCLVNSLHYGPLMRAIDHGKHVYCEKPLTIDLGEAERLLAAATAAGLHHGVVQNMRFNAGPRKARELLARGVVGRVFSADVLFGYMVPRRVLNRPTWFYKKDEAGGGVVEDMMAHFFDLLRSLLGPIEGLYAATGIAWAEREEPDGTPFRVEVEDVASVSIRFAGGAVGNCFASWVRRKHEEVPEFQIDGEDGSLLFSFNKLWVQRQADTPLFRFDARQVQPDSLGQWRSVELDLRDPFGLQLEQFLAGIVRGRPSGPDWRDAVTNLRLIKAAYLSVAERREVRPDEIEAEVAR
jgi:predicted dehydrogenase